MLLVSALVGAVLLDPADVGSVVRPLVKFLVDENFDVGVDVEGLVIELVKNF